MTHQTPEGYIAHVTYHYDTGRLLEEAERLIHCGHHFAARRVLEAADHLPAPTPELASRWDQIRLRLLQELGEAVPAGRTIALTLSYEEFQRLMNRGAGTES